MHILETYALSCGLKIDRPHVYEHFTSVPFDKFISFNRKFYPYFPEVIKLIRPELNNRGIGILQIKATQETQDVADIVQDGLSFGQFAYIIRRSMLHFGEDDFLFDLAGFYDIPRVQIFSTTFPNTFKPYWGTPDKQRIVFETGPFKKPSFSGDGSNNFVRLVKPELIAQHIMDLLGIPWKPSFETVFIGAQYRPHHDLVEIVPDKNNPITLNGRVAAINVRMDYGFDEGFLANILEKAKASVITDRPINLNLLQSLRHNVNEVVYLINEESDIQFMRNLARLNLPCGMIAFHPSMKLKERFFEVGAINPITVPKIGDIKEIQGGIEGFVYKSAKRVLHGSNTYKSQHEFANKLASDSDSFSPIPSDTPALFMKEIDFFMIAKPVSPKT